MTAVSICALGGPPHCVRVVVRTGRHFLDRMGRRASPYRTLLPISVLPVRRIPPHFVAVFVWSVDIVLSIRSTLTFVVACFLQYNLDLREVGFWAISKYRLLKTEHAFERRRAHPYKGNALTDRRKGRMRRSGFNACRQSYASAGERICALHLEVRLALTRSAYGNSWHSTTVHTLATGSYGRRRYRAHTSTATSRCAPPADSEGSVQL